MIELTLAMIIWGTLGVFVLWSGASAMEVAFYRCLIGFIAIALYFIQSKQKFHLSKNIIYISAAGLFLVLNWIFLFYSFQLSSITIGNISYYLQPIILIIFGIFIYNEKVSLKNWLFILLSFVGVVLTIDIANFNEGNTLWGVCFALIAAILYSFVTVLMKKVEDNFFKILLIQFFIGAIFIFPFIEIKNILPLSGWCLLVIGIVHTLLAYLLYYKAIKKTNFTSIAVISYLDPIVAILTDIVFFDRTLSFLQIMGVMLTFVSGCLLVVSQNRNR